MLLGEYKITDKQHKPIKSHLKDLKKFLHEIDEIIHEMEEGKEKLDLIDVIKKVEKKYRNISKIKEEKRDKYKEVAIKKKNISYEKEIIKMQLELVKLQRHIEETGQKVLIIFEGRDAAGKGGNIKRFMEYLNPRNAKVVALQKPTEQEQSQWYFQRYLKHLPNGGEMALFDRSWYNRGGVEPVMGFVNKKNYEKFMHDVPKLEDMLISSGVKVIKLSITQFLNLNKRNDLTKEEEIHSNNTNFHRLISFLNNSGKNIHLLNTITLRILQQKILLGLLSILMIKKSLELILLNMSFHSLIIQKKFLKRNLNMIKK